MSDLVTCPLCSGLGCIDRLFGPRGVGRGHYIMVRTGGAGRKAYVKCEVTKFEHSGVKLVNDGWYTFRYPSESGVWAGKEERRRSSYDSDELMKCCPRCDGRKEVIPNTNDRLLAEKGVPLIVSGKGTFYFAQDSERTWVAYRSRWARLSSLDLLTDRDGRVWKMADGYPKITDDSVYWTVVMEGAGPADSYVEEEPKECGEHGWYFEDSCPDCLPEGRYEHLGGPFE